MVPSTCGSIRALSARRTLDRSVNGQRSGYRPPDRGWPGTWRHEIRSAIGCRLGNLARPRRHARRLVLNLIQSASEEQSAAHTDVGAVTKKIRVEPADREAAMQAAERQSAEVDALALPVIGVGILLSGGYPASSLGYRLRSWL